jgi:hypothetical protein
MEKGVDMPVHNPRIDLDLDCPLPPCFHAMYLNIDTILSDFEELEIEIYGRSFAPLPTAVDGSEEDDAVTVEFKIEAGYEEDGQVGAPGVISTAVEPGPPLKKMRQSTLAQAFGGRTHTGTT